MTKKEIYAKYGIEYKSGKILSPLFGWVALLLINGNAKLGKGVYTFSILPTNELYQFIFDGIEFQVRGTCPCHCKGCYATKGFYCMSSTKNSLAKKTILVRECLDWVKRAILAQIEAENIKMLRIHASGDFMSAEYIQMWREIVDSTPSTVYWTYTKNPDAEHAFDDMNNINVVPSLVKGFGFNFGHCDYILKVYRALKELGERVYICRCGIDPNQHCVNCKGCSENTFVLFIEHSTEYKAEDDPCFEELKAIIENQ